MSLHQDLFNITQRIAGAIDLPPVTGLYFPRLQHDDTFRDEFGFVFLQGGAIGAFYVSLNDTLAELWQRFPEPETVQLPLSALLEHLSGPDNHALADSALGVGAYNALSQHVMALANYRPAARQRKTDTAAEISGRVGMVGYFCPLIERLTAQGTEVVVLENLPERVLANPLVSHVSTPHGLADCEQIICTASTLINDTLDEVIAACTSAQRFALTGPTASGLPDAVFARGVDTVGAIHFPDRQQLTGILDAGMPWGKAGHKYEISRADYPGLETLLQRVTQPDHN
ncbi:MAG: DUF364 domain-containing protein [Thiolinea sp.]